MMEVNAKMGKMKLLSDFERSIIIGVRTGPASICETGIF